MKILSKYDNRKHFIQMLHSECPSINEHHHTNDYLTTSARWHDSDQPVQTAKTDHSLLFSTMHVQSNVFSSSTQGKG